MFPDFSEEPPWSTTFYIDNGEDTLRLALANSFTVAAGWNAVTVISGPEGGPHTFRMGLDEELAWYWFAFEEPTPE